MKNKKMISIIIISLLAVCLVALAIVSNILIIPNANYKKNLNLTSETIKNVKELNESGDRIHFLATGSSDAIILESDGHFAMVDSGEDNDNPRGFEALELKGYEEEVLAYLKQNIAGEDGKVVLDFVLGTHCHSDHIGGFDTIISDKDVEIKTAYLRQYDESKIDEMEVNEWDNKEVYEQMVNALNEKNIPIVNNMENVSFEMGNFKITFFNGEEQNDEGLVGENDNAIGTLIECRGKRIFLAADIDNKSGDEERLKDDIGKVDILKVGHHSYSHSTSVPWLKTLNPELCVVTNDDDKIDMRTIRKITRVAKSSILTTGGQRGLIVDINSQGEISLYNEIM